MTQKLFEKEIARILKRVALLQAMQRGDVGVRKITVAGHWVPKHYVQKHTRLIAGRAKNKIGDRALQLGKVIPFRRAA